MTHSADFSRQYEAARDGAVHFDVSDRGKIEIRGRDASTFLHNLCTNDVKGLAVGAGCEAFLTTGQAKVVSFCRIERVAPESLWLDVASMTAPKVVAHLEHYHVTEDVEITDRTSEFSQFHVAGPRSTNVLAGTGVTRLDRLSILHHVEAAINGVSCRVRRHEPLDLPGYDLICSNDAKTGVAAALEGAGTSKTDSGLYHLLRIEAGTPEYGIDIDETNLPQEIGRTARAVSFTKGCYIGQETVARIRTYGHVNRSLVGLRLAENREVPSGSIVRRDGVEIGHVTSSAVSPGARTGIALGYVRRGSNEPGTLVEIVVDGGGLRGEVRGFPIVAHPST